jgi:hypothetical protein
MDGLLMTLEFDCGTVAPNVGEVPMALKWHLTLCTDESCRADVQKELDNARK